MYDVSPAPPEPGLISLAAQSGAQKAGENIISRALDAVIDSTKRKFGEAGVHLGTAFRRYLENASKRYNLIRTLATGPTPRSIIGQDNIYVSIGLQYQGKEYDTSTIDPLLRISRRLLILGTGGAGKSMLMRYLFLNTANRGEYVPILLELRRVSNQTQGQISILDLIYACMLEYDAQLQREQLEYSLRLGKYLFLFDGLDEVRETLSGEAAEALQAFSAKYPKNPCVITSRPKENASLLETFTIVESMPLKKEQAVLLASKIWEEDEKTKEFCRQLDELLYDKHRDFAENPLLLSMMFLTFMRNSSIPDHLADFYQKSYDALYSAHDGHDKGCYRRDFCCKALDEGTFKLIFSHFCFHSYFREIYEFSESEILSLLQRSIAKIGAADTSPAGYLTDLRNVVCMIVRDGDIYRFSHRSFQAYFAACYTSQVLSDEQQTKLFHSYLSDGRTFFERQDYYTLLSQIEPERFSANALEAGLRELMERIAGMDDPDVFLLKTMYQAVSFRENNQLSYTITFHGEGLYYFNIVQLYTSCATAGKGLHLPSEEYHRQHAIVKEFFQRQGVTLSSLDSFSQIDDSTCFTDEERHALYSALAVIDRIPETCASIRDWLSELDAKRASLKLPDFIDDL